MKKFALALLPFAVASFAQAQSPECGNIGTLVGSYFADPNDPYLTASPNDEYYRCELSGVISSDITLEPFYNLGPFGGTFYVVWELDGVVEVGNGGEVMVDDATTIGGAPLQNVTLTVLPGVHFRSEFRGSLVITRGSQIVANGTPAQPITFASLDNDYVNSLAPSNGEWGGLVVMGMARSNGENNRDTNPNAAGDLCGGAGDAEGDNICNLLAEGLDRDQDGLGDVYFGGYNDGDSSGSLQYVVIAEGGFTLASASEVNGLTLYTVGSGTTIQNLQVHGNSDDGVEFFGGAVNVSNLVLTNNFDDSIDWDLGYTGTITNALVEKCASSDHGMELSGVDDELDYTLAFDAVPLTDPTANNVTLRVYGGAATGEALNLKEGTGGSFNNLHASGFSLCLDEDNNTVDFGRLSFGTTTFLNCSDAVAAYDRLGVTTADRGAATPIADFWSAWALPGTGTANICSL